jgi:hypothetical protein
VDAIREKLAPVKNAKRDACFYDIHETISKDLRAQKLIYTAPIDCWYNLVDTATTQKTPIPPLTLAT